MPGDVIGSVIEEDSDSILEWCLGSIQEAAVASGAVFSDGSGGEAWVPQQIRRVGAGSASVDFEFDGSKFVARSVGLALSEVRGKQTVPRAELAAAELAFRVTPLAAPVLWSDARYVVDGANSSGARQESLLLGSNGDGWGTFFDMYKHEERPPVRKGRPISPSQRSLHGKYQCSSMLGTTWRTQRQMRLHRYYNLVRMRANMWSAGRALRT